MFVTGLLYCKVFVILTTSICLTPTHHCWHPTGRLITGHSLAGCSMCTIRAWRAYRAWSSFCSSHRYFCNRLALRLICRASTLYGLSPETSSSKKSCSDKPWIQVKLDRAMTSVYFPGLQDQPHIVICITAIMTEHLYNERFSSVEKVVTDIGWF